MKKILGALIVVCVIIIGYWAYRTTNLQQVTVSLKWLHQAQFAGLYVADDQGLYRNNGLSVTLKEFNFQTTPADDLKNGTVDFALMSPEEFLSSINDGDDFVAVAVFYQISPYALVSLSEKNIVSPADFYGKTLGDKGGKIEEKIIYSLLLEEFGISSSDVTRKTLGYEQKEIDDLLAGDADVVDLYRTDQLYFFDQNSVTYNLVKPEKYGVNTMNDLLVVRRDYLLHHTDSVRSFVEASILGWGKALNDIDGAVSATMKYVTNPDYQSIDYQRFILNNSAQLIKPSQSSFIGDIQVNHLKYLYDTMKKNQFIDSDFDVEDFVTKDFIFYTQ